ncbi:hypothetical protein COV12_02110 [Candidatus Woesearchaeota archaeon CG10_big_fil_rev_8_21_14_0_10_32_24]|nr:MAG: hypothetical protein COV12_02110 [Candidatus Woesearchaeota archaeon CG10_big_fil_rev_8_21_14_0_10_32_24]
MNKKGGADMWWIIIGAVLAIIVLVVLVFMFTSSTGRAKVGISACYAGSCMPKADCGNGTINPSIECPKDAFDTDQFCCVGGGKKLTT